MKLVAKAFLNESDRWKSALQRENARFNDCVVNIADVLDAHFTIADFLFQKERTSRPSTYIGAIDGQRLISSVSRQKDVCASKSNGDSDYEKCATLFYGLISNHPFQRFNSSTALLSMLFYLSKIGRVPTAHYKELEVITRIIASNEIRQRSAFGPYSEFKDGEVQFLARYLQENTRQVGKKDVVLTYNELNRLLTTSGLLLTHSHGRLIDIVHKQRRLPAFKRSGGRDQYAKIGTLDFTGWNDKVPDRELSRLSEIASSHPGCNGWDYASICIHGPHLQSLIQVYFCVFQCIVEDDEKRSRDFILDDDLAASSHR